MTDAAPPSPPSSAGRNNERPPSARPVVSTLIAWRDTAIAAAAPAENVDAGPVPADIAAGLNALPNLDDPNLSPADRSAALAEYRRLTAGASTGP